MRLRLRTTSLLLSIGIALLLGALVIDRYGVFARLKRAVQTTSVGSGMVDYGTMGSIFKRLHLVTPHPNDFERFPANERSDEEIETRVFQKKRLVEEYVYAATSPDTRTFRSSEVIRTLQVQPHWPIVSIVVEDEFLHDPDHGILVNRDQKGRDWERIAEVSYAEAGTILFETQAGIRMHGGKRLDTGEFAPGFRLYFRNTYGLDRVPAGLMLPDLPVPLRTVVLQTTAWPPGYPLNNPIAYDIARRVGCIVPDTRLVLIYLNGEPYSLGFATEHLSRRQWGQRFADDDYFFVKYRSHNTNKDLVAYREKIDPLLKETTVLDVEHVDRLMDLDNLTAQVIAWAFCGTGDYCQGVAAGNRNDPASKLFYITWDMDHSFWDGSALNYSFDRLPWQQPALEGFLEKQGKRRTCWRTYIFNRLFSHDPQYRILFLQQLNTALNHRLSPAFLTDRLDYYRAMLIASGQPHEAYMELLAEFFQHRAAFIYSELHTLFSIPQPFSCSLSVPKGRSVSVDGYEYHASYQGFYYPSTPVSLELTDTGTDSANVSWIVNGKVFDQPKLIISLAGDTTIDLVVAPAAAGEPQS